jgi:hypothetical protein
MMTPGGEVGGKSRFWLAIYEANLDRGSVVCRERDARRELISTMATEGDSGNCTIAVG